MRSSIGDAAPATSSRIRVFLIDDHASVLWGLERLVESDRALTLAGSATTVDAALDRVSTAVPDVIVLDLDLAGQSSIDWIPRLLSASKAKILVLTGVADRAAHDAAVLAGASGVITKNVGPGEILKAIAKVSAGELWADRATTYRLVTALLGQQRNTQSVDEQKIATLTARERHIVSAVTSTPTMSLKEVAKSLSITERTLRNHLSAIYQKLGVSGRLELYIYAKKYGVYS